jgi:hypothetical protein
LLEHQQNLFDTSYEVQRSVPLGIFELFVEAMETGTKVPVTKENNENKLPSHYLLIFIQSGDNSASVSQHFLFLSKCQTIYQQWHPKEFGSTRFLMRYPRVPASDRRLISLRIGGFECSLVQLARRYSFLFNSKAEFDPLRSPLRRKDPPSDTAIAQLQGQCSDTSKS